MARYGRGPGDGLRTVRLAVVEQHGVPRAKWLSPEAAIATPSSRSTSPAPSTASTPGTNQVFAPAFTASGDFGIGEFIGIRRCDWAGGAEAHVDGRELPVGSVYRSPPSPATVCGSTATASTSTDRSR